MTSIRAKGLLGLAWENLRNALSRAHRSAQSRALLVIRKAYLHSRTTRTDSENNAHFWSLSRYEFRLSSGMITSPDNGNIRLATVEFPLGERLKQGRKHPANCENATRETCKCGHCTGTRHGWVGALHLARSGEPEGLRNFEQDVEKRWRKECNKQESKNHRQPQATLPHKKAAVDSARSDLIQWIREKTRWGGHLHIADTTPQNDSRLADARIPCTPDESHESDPQPPADGATHPTARAGDPELDPAATDRALAAATSEVDQTEALGYMLGQVVNDVEKDVGPLRPGTRQAMADHFWCELLVQLVVVIEESNRRLDSVPDAATKGIIESRRESGLTKIQRKIIVACTKQVWKRLVGASGLIVISDAKVLLPALRILALLMCKSPPRHPAVVEHCVDPLKALLIQETKKRLVRVFGELVPQITFELGGGASLAQRG